MGEENHKISTSLCNINPSMHQISFIDGAYRSCVRQVLLISVEGSLIEIDLPGWSKNSPNSSLTVCFASGKKVLVGETQSTFIELNESLAAAKMYQVFG